MAAVLREITQHERFDSAAEAAVVTLLRTADRLRGSIARTVGEEGLTEQQYNVLRILRGAGSRGLPTLEIGSRMIEHCPGVTRIVDRLLSAGLVVRGRGDSDRRQVVCRITPKGTSLLGALDGPVRATAERVMTPLGVDGLHELVRLLDLARTGTEAVTTHQARTNRNRGGEPK